MSQQFAVESGVTSIFLDLPLLEEAAGLTEFVTDSDAEPFSEDFLVGFSITEETDFSLAPVPFTPLGGTIEHSGTITRTITEGVGGEATIGDFSIGYDESRISDTASGFFVADTLEDPLGWEIIFDVGTPETVNVSGEDLEISGADLFLAPEAAIAFGLTDLAGVDVGDVRVDATVTPIAVDPREPPTEPVDEAVFNFTWTGQIAGFSVEGQFSYDENQSYADGIVREDDLLDFDISFFDPDGNLLRTYEDNHLTFPEFNLAYDTNTGEILQDGYFLADDGFNVGEKTPVGEDEFTGLNFWSRPEFNSQGEVPPPHLHIDDWSDEFGFPIGFSSHEDVAFLTRTTAELIETGKVGETYLDQVQNSLDEVGQRIEVLPI